MAIHQNELQNSGGDPYKCAPRGLNTHILTKNCPKYGIIQIIALFGWTFDNAKYPQIYIQDKACWYFFIINGETVGGTPIYRHHGGSNTQILTKITYANKFPIWIIW